MFRFMQPSKNCAQYTFFSSAVRAKGFSCCSVPMQDVTAPLQISFRHVSPSGEADAGVVQKATTIHVREHILLGGSLAGMGEVRRLDVFKRAATGPTLPCPALTWPASWPRPIGQGASPEIKMLTVRRLRLAFTCLLVAI